MPRLPHFRFLMFLALFVGLTLAALPHLPVEQAVLIGFDLAATAFIAASFGLWRDNRPDAVSARGAGDDGNRVLLLVTALIVLGTVMTALGRVIGGSSTTGALEVVWVSGTLVLAWIFVNLVYAYHYAHLYYVTKGGKQARGLSFPGDQPPLFADFCYFSFVLGMTCQVADVAIETRSMRRVAMLHGLLAFFFNLGVLALTVNILAGLLKG